MKYQLSITNKCCVIFGYTEIAYIERLYEPLYTVIENEIKNGINKFIMFVHGDFDRLALYVCRKLRKQYDIQIVVAITLFTRYRNTGVGSETGLPFNDFFEDTTRVDYKIKSSSFQAELNALYERIINQGDKIITYASAKDFEDPIAKALLSARQQKKEIINLHK